MLWNIIANDDNDGETEYDIIQYTQKHEKHDTVTY